jgi:predicted phosphate transport protein (TIGR00153 family)
MKLDRILQAFLPKDRKFFDLFDKDVANLLAGARVFKEAMSNNISKEERAQKIRKLEELEHTGDEITHQIFSELANTFITPIDREDIHSLATHLDDILDYIQGSANRIILYRIESISPEQEKIASLLYDQVVELNKAIPLLHHLKNATKIRACLVRINSMENEADDLFERAIANLFDTCKDPIYLIKMKELLVSMETATDQCEDAANVIESIMIKNA